MTPTITLLTEYIKLELFKGGHTSLLTDPRELGDLTLDLIELQALRPTALLVPIVTHHEQL